MRVRKKIMKYVCSLLLVLVGGLFTQHARAQSGPAQPEAMQFEPVDVTDVVNLATGDFVYTLPLMEVPGPEGNYPIVLSYHSNIGPNQPATWVGLGWTLNPGSINRTLSGYPDDYNGDLVKTHIEDHKDLEWGISIGAGWGPVGLNMTYDHYSGMMGANMMVNIAPKEFGGFGISASAGTNSSSAGIGYQSGLGGGLKGNVGISAGSQGISVNGGISQDLGNKYNNNLSLASTGVNLSSRGKANFRIGGIGFSSVTQAGEGKVYSSGFSFTVPLLGTFWVSFGYQGREWKLNETYNEPSFGYLYQDEYFESFENEKKYERQLADDFLFASTDIFNANAQGLNGTFTAYKAEPYQLFDEKGNDEKANLAHSWKGKNFSINKEKRFRFLDDQGGNVAFNNYWGEKYKEIKSTRFREPRYTGKRITPLFNEETGKLGGFVVTDSDGKKYEFKQPVKNLYKYSETQTKDPDDDFLNYNSMATPYATSWLLTAVKGPDYVDRDRNGNVGDGDWGYWVDLSYTKIKKPEIWRAPYNGFGTSVNSKKMENYSIGIRDQVYLESIETRTHLAKFNLNPHQNRFSSTGVNSLKILARGKIKNGSAVFSFHDIDLSWTKKLIDSNQIGEEENLLTFKGYKYYSPNERVIGSFSKKDISIEYNPQTKTTYLEAETDDINLRNVYGTFYLNKLLRKSYSTAKKLTEVQLYKKENTQNPINSVEFEYDYSLRPNTPGSKADKEDGAFKGTLTLKSVKFLGQNSTSIMPPYNFEYANGRAPGVELNPSWHRYNWDRWGSYRAPESGREFDGHDTPQDKDQADKSAAWALTKITNPTGSTVEIEYESDGYYHVNNTFDLDKVKTAPIQNPGHETATFELYTNGETENLLLSENKNVQFLVESEVTECRGYYDDDCYTDSSTNYIDKIYKIENYNPSSNTITLNKPFSFQQNQYNGRDSEEYRYTLVIPQNVYGGGSRVKRISTSDGANQHTTYYSYKSGEYSTGVTTSLPAPYADEKHDLPAAPNSYLQAFMDHRYSYGRPAPGVIYSKVQVENTDKSGENINGKTVYEFYTSKDFPYSVDDDGEELIIKDRSGIYGKPKATIFYEKVGQNKFRPIKRNEFVYAFSDELSDRGSLYIKGEELEDEKKLPGITQQKYAFSNHKSENETVEREIDHTYMNVYGAGQQSTSYFYVDEQSLNPDDSLVTKSLPFGWDAYTGSAILTAQSTSDTDEAIVDEATPAYWKYDGMEDKNMLTQNFQQSSYKTERLNLNNSSSLKSFETDPVELLSSTVTTWSDHWYDETDGSPQIWRKNDTYVYDRGFPYKDFPEAHEEKVSADYLRPKKNIPWKQTSNVTKYDKFGHAIESVSQDGRYTTTMYGPNQRLVKGIAANTANDEVTFYNYENSSSASTNAAHTGTASRRVSGSTTLGTAPNVSPESARRYKAQLWVLATNGNIEVGSKTVSQGNDWKFIEIDNLLPGQSVSARGTGYIDDFVIMPQTATFSSYTYDPLTEQLTSMTDANNNTSYFEYDDAGRLIAKRDLDKNLVQRYSYGYGSNYNIGISDEQPDENQELTFTVEDLGHQSNAQEYIWDFGTGERLSTHDSTVAYTFLDSGFKTVSLLVADKENTNLRVSKRFYVAGTGEDDFNIHLNVESDPGDKTGIVRAEVENGTKPYSYQWLSRFSTDSPWTELSEESGVLEIVVPFGSVEVKCKVIDADGRYDVSGSFTLIGPDLDK